MADGIDYLVTMAKASRFVRRADASDGGWENMFGRMRGLLAQVSDALADAGLDALADAAVGFRSDFESVEARYADASAALLDEVRSMHAAGFGEGSAGGLAAKAEALRSACGAVSGLCAEVTSFCEAGAARGGVCEATLPMVASLAEEMAESAAGVVESVDADLPGGGA